MTTFFKLTGALFSWGHVFFFRLSDEKCPKNSVYWKNQPHRCSHILTGDRGSLKENGHFLLSVSERLYAKRKAMRHMCKKTVTQHLAKRDSRLPAYGSVVMQIFYFMKAFTMKNEFVMSHYFLFIIAQNIFNYCLLYSQRIERSMFLLNCLLFPIILLHRIP